MLTRFGDFVLDPETRQLTTDDGAPVHLTRKAFDLLVLLAAHAPRVVSKSEIHERLWVDSFVSDATLVGLVKELRRAVCDVDPKTPVIRTVHGVGYAFGPSVSAGGAPGTARAHWLILEDRRVILRPGANIVGRDPSAEIWINATSVSRRHARIDVSAEVVVEDLGSKNGTTVRGQPVTGPEPVQDGDSLEFGWIRCVYRTASVGMSTETRSRRARRPKDSGESSDD